FNVLREQLLWQQGHIKIFGKTIAEPRLTAWYGDLGITYKYSGKTMETRPWHPDLLNIKNKIEDCSSAKYNSVLCNLYRNGEDSMGWHADDESSLGANPTIASLSLGAARTFQLKHRTKPYKITLMLRSGSLLLMSGTLQHHWVHRLPKTSSVITERINLTFRKLNL
ncbi:MAG TPA: alpha-ketoglutarate-dependent dioxygenase AlkB, partial [Cytophagales bacterium]|nr:alpha-ketoglutarate-dependent dioxygenase AlkB [Cytophagales bacterium]